MIKRVNGKLKQCVKQNNPRANYLPDKSKAQGMPADFTTSELWFFKRVPVNKVHNKLIFHFALHTQNFYGWNIYYVEVEKEHYLITYMQGTHHVTFCHKVSPIAYNTMTLPELRTLTMKLTDTEKGKVPNNFIFFGDFAK